MRELRSAVLNSKLASTDESHGAVRYTAFYVASHSATHAEARRTLSYAVKLYIYNIIAT